MATENGHTITLRGVQLEEILRRAGAEFATFFGDLGWELTSVTAYAQVVALRNGAGVHVAEAIDGWEVTCVATVPALVVEVSA